MEGSPTNHNQQAAQILQKQNSLILESLNPSCDNDLFDAILNGELDNVKRCIESGALVNQVSKGTEITALHLAVACGNVTIVKLLLARGADVRLRDKKGRETVHVAAALGNPEMLGLLIDNFCDVNSVVAADTSDEDVTGELPFELFNMVDPNHDTAMKKIPIMEIGDTPLFLAANKNHKECVILLIERGAKIILDDTIDYNVLFSRNTVLARYIIDMLKDGVGSRPSTPPVVIRGGEEFKLSITCLHEAIEQEDLPLIDFLVDFDPCQLIQEKDRLYPLHRLVRKQLLKPVENVLVKRNEPQIREVKYDSECTPLHMAVFSGWLPGVKALLKAGADVTLYSKYRQTVLHLATESGKLEILEEILRSPNSGEILDAQVPQGYTPLYIAVCREWLPGVKALLGAGADVTIYPKDGPTVLHIAAHECQLEILEELLKSSKSLEIRDAKDNYERTPLYMAVYREWLPGVKALLEAGADVTLYPKDKPTVLHVAAGSGKLEILEELLKSSKSGEIRDAKDHSECTPLYLAVDYKWLPGVKALLKAGADVTLYPKDQQTVLHRAVEYSQLEILEELLKSYKSGEIRDTKDLCEFTPLYYAVHREWLPGVKALLKAGADVTIYSTIGRTVLHRAAESCQLEILEELLKSPKSGKIRDATDDDWRTPLFLAVRSEWLPGVKALLEAGADVTIHPWDRQTVLHLAAGSCQLDILDELLKSSKSIKMIHMVNDSQETPLCYAVRAGQLDKVKLIISKGADTNFMLPGGRTLLHLAAEQGSADILDYLILFCTELSIINYSDINGLTALHFAALNGSHSCVSLLFNNGCDVNKKTKDHHLSGSTPLHLAAEKGHNEVVEQIICHKKDTLNITDANNYIPLQIAAMYNNKECLRFMLHNGADIGAIVKSEFGDEMTALEFIVSNIHNAAEFLTETFDQCIKEEMDPERLKKSITVNFDLFRPSSYGNQLRVLESFLNCENEDLEENLLLHPVVETCLYVKWTKFMGFFFAMIVLQMTYTVSLNVMAMSLYTTESQTTFVNNSVFICRCTMSSSLLLIILLELLQASRLQRYYFKDLESWVKWTMILLSFLVLVGDHPADWLVDVSAVAVLLSWIEVLFQISRWHSFPGLYVLMFFAVAKSAIKVLATFFFVILGYVFAFMIYFRAKGPFRNWPTSFYKVMVMMNEMDYESVFEGFGEQDVLVGRGIFLSFMVLVVIVLMNLLLGLAVDDIQNLKKKGKAKCLAKQIGFFCMLELFVHSVIDSKYCPDIIVKLIEPWKKLDYKLTIESGNRQSLIKKSLKTSLINIIMKQKIKSKEASKDEAKTGEDDNLFSP